MAAPALLQYQSEAAINNAHITGPVIATFSTIAIWEATRPCRWMSFAGGLWMILAPFVLGHWQSEIQAASSDILAGAAVAVVSLFRGKIEGRYGGGWSVLWKGTQ